MLGLYGNLSVIFTGCKFLVTDKGLKPILKLRDSNLPVDVNRIILEDLDSDFMKLNGRNDRHHLVYKECFCLSR